MMEKNREALTITVGKRDGKRYLKAVTASPEKYGPIYVQDRYGYGRVLVKNVVAQEDGRFKVTLLPFDASFVRRRVSETVAFPVFSKTVKGKTSMVLFFPKKGRLKFNLTPGFKMSSKEFAQMTWEIDEYRMLKQRGAYR
jgi:hypothetical protein